MVGIQSWGRPPARGRCPVEWVNIGLRQNDRHKESVESSDHLRKDTRRQSILAKESLQSAQCLSAQGAQR